MVVNDISDAKHVPLVLHLLHQVAYIAPVVVLARRREVRVQLQLISQRVAGARLTQRLQRRKVDHVITCKETHISDFHIQRAPNTTIKE